MIRGRAPLRISFAGGGTDVDDVFEKYGGKVINATIDKFIHGTINGRADGKIYINRKPLSASDDFTRRLVSRLPIDQGFDFWYSNDLPPGKGLGSSSTYSVLLTKLVSELQGRKIPEDKIVEKVYGMESEAGMCGWQDQYAAAYGGFNFISFEKDKKMIYPLRLREPTILELEESLMLVDTGINHNSAEIQEENIPLITREKAELLQEYAEKVTESLVKGRPYDIAYYLQESWNLKKNQATTNEKIEQVFEIAQGAGMTSGKLLGAGKGGYFLAFVHPEMRKEFKTKINRWRLECLDFHFTNKGVETWEV